MTSPKGFSGAEPTQTSPIPSDGNLGDAGRPRGYLVVMRGKTVGMMFPLRQKTVIGRSPTADICLDDQGVSRVHTAIQMTPTSTFEVMDLNSRNGTRVNGETVSELPRGLVYGDRIEIGSSTVLKFLFQDDLEIQLQDSQRMEAIGRLAGGIAHEFNNLLTVIFNNLTHLQVSLQADDFDRAELLECIDDSLYESRRGAQLTRNLLGFARRGPFDPKRVQLDEFIEGFARLISRTLERNIEVVAEVEPDLTVYCDRSQLHQVMLNLGLNARDAMPDGGILRLEARSRDLSESDLQVRERGLPPGTYVEVAMSDTGTGMDEYTLDHMFEPFFSTKVAGKGTGLGLSVVDGIVRTHNGHLTAESQRGKGTSVRIFLPAALPEPEQPAPGRERSDTGVFEILGGAVLIVDDEEGVRSSVERLLVNAGFDVMQAENGKAALEIFHDHRDQIGVVLLDLSMPGLDGEETFARLRDIDPNARVIICSGHIADDRLARLREAGVHSFLTKPFELKTLTRALANAMTPRASS